MIFRQRIHWFSLINSLVIVTFLCIMVSMILYRTVSRDVSSVFFVSADMLDTDSFKISRYNAIDLSVRYFPLYIVWISDLPPGGRPRRLGMEARAR